jgi:hypothetical protein
MFKDLFGDRNKADKTANQGVDDDVIAGIPMLDPLPGNFYTGVVVDSKDGYSFIGEVRQGYSLINTHGDVFCPMVLPVGARVQFDMLNPNPEKGENRFRTESATVLDEQLVTQTGTISTAMALSRLSQARTAYHNAAKLVDAELVEKAAGNKPFEAMLYRAGAEYHDGAAPIAEIAANFLAGQYAGLGTMGATFGINPEEFDQAAEDREVESAIRFYSEQGMDGQVKSIRQQYDQFKGVRKIFTMMHQRGILSMQSVIPMTNLPDLLVAAPVWFIDAKTDDLPDNSQANDPHPDAAVKFFCTLGKTQRFANLYQMYNRRTRPINTFSGRDLMPPAIGAILQEARKVFDFVVIATPYHDIASTEWNDPNWQRLLDPFLFGFSKDLPFMFLLGRWSGTGLFPLVCDMVADTMAHVALNTKTLQKFSSNAYWFDVSQKQYEDSCLHNIGTELVDSLDSHPLVRFAIAMTKAFEEGHLFAFLRGENPPVELASNKG